MSELIEAINDQDIARMRAVLADAFANDDHRRTGVGRIDGVDAYLEGIAATRGLVRDAQLEILSVCATERHGAVGTVLAFGTLADGGDFEVPYTAAITVAGGRITRNEIFEVDQLDAALARLAKLRPDPLRIPPKTVTRRIGYLDRSATPERRTRGSRVHQERFGPLEELRA